ncbi:S-layer homology domain-containing protein [Paenibacillus sp. FSL R7-0204]|uniref:S-layer homology domain-containing protein n=1 Tax=Paenibacillus sp. FSL R7-0204 TaxID=2921675 RepID=UPI0030FA991E
MATGRLVTDSASGWTAIDFSAADPYLQKDKMYRMVVTTDVGGLEAGIGWYSSSGNPYPRGSSPATNYDFSFRTYMVADYSVSPGNSQIFSTHSSLVADGSSQTMVTVRLWDAQGNVLTSGGAAVTISATAGTVGVVTDNRDGTYSAKLTAPTSAGSGVVSASVDGTMLDATASVQFTSGEFSTLHSTVTASDLVVRADGQSSAEIIVRLQDDYEHPIAGKRLMLEANSGQSVIQNVYGTTDAEGLTAFSVSNTAAEKVTYMVKEEASGLALLQTVSISFTYDQPPRIILEADPPSATYGSVKVTVSASVYGEFNQISAVKWAAGSRDIAYFAAAGTEITDHFAVQENGVYSVYVADVAGNANVSNIEISNIVPLSSNADLIAWELTGLGGQVRFDFKAGAASYTVNADHAVYALKMRLAAADELSALQINGSQISPNLITGEYPLAIGENRFEVTVTAQDHTTRTYILTVIRSAAPAEPAADSGTNPSSSPAITLSQPPQNRSILIRINDKGVSGMASFDINADQIKAITVRIDTGSLKNVLESLFLKLEEALTIAIEEEADKLTLRLPGSAISSLMDKQVAAIAMKTRNGQYRLPLAEIGNRLPDFTDETEVQITIERGDSKALAGLQEAADQGGFRLVAAPIYFEVHIVRQGVRQEISSFNHYVERVIYLPKDAHAASAVMVWDQKLGARPVATVFAEVDGQRAAVIQSLTNSAYILVAKTPAFTDLAGHWAAKEISDMNSRMIVQGIDGTRFAPGAAITRAELAALLARALGLPEATGQSSFRDVAESSWYREAVESVQAYGIMDGFADGTFKPQQAVTRQEAIVTIIRALQMADAASVTDSAGKAVDLSVYADSGEIGSWADEAIRIAIAEGLVQGYGEELRPGKPLTRAETAVLLYRMLIQARLING